MPKLRNAASDVGAFTQYLARKCVIHQPQAELDLTANARSSKPRMYREKGKAKVHMLRSGDSNQFLAISPGGRAMLVTVDEVDPAEFADTPKAAVGS